ncbi:hypothetical protein NCAS_0E01070 [Naumovozyma castellii]|uniref:Telomere length regulation protein conserved domain-containing protein n=1 Tax=Naumovozyma castellii TaxID=27288 RepID=G0VFB2_NAUCA|nr:hypothetical protein NCAS_0E01070 [Naumovozyma castellii CBS 4309]CCC70177.1 hypothetical protein NCAS_0E01070 [Naumovozyma castellii CBS 4309]
MSDFKVLKDHPDAQVIEDVLQQLSNETDAPTLEVCLLIIQHVIPIYPSLSKHTRDLTQSLVSRSFTFMSQLVNYASTVMKDKPEGKLYRNFIKEVLATQPECLHNYLIHMSSSRMEKNYLKTLFFGSRVFNSLGNDIDIIEYLELLRSQWKSVLDDDILIETLVLDSFLGELLVSSLILNPTYAMDLLFGDLFLSTETYATILNKIILNASNLDQQRLVNKFLLPYLEPLTNTSNFKSTNHILRELPLHKCITLDVILRMKSHILQEIIIRQMSEFASSIIPSLISKFGTLDESQDEDICIIFVMVLKFNLNEEQREQLAHDGNFLDAITKRLSHKNSEFRERTMFIAKLASNNELEYDSDFVIKLPDLDITNNEKIEIDPALFKRSSSGVSASKVSRISSGFHEMVLQEDSDDEVQDDEQEIINRIVFLKDLVKEFEKNGNDGPAESIPLLKKTITLVRQKEHFPLEVDYYFSGLLTNIAYLNNNLEESNFEEWRINALVSLLVVVPEKVQELIKIFLSSELSLQQRMSILSSLGLSARELRGMDDKVITKPKLDFPTSRLPWDKKTKEQHDKKRITELGNSNSTLIETKTTWKSKKLTLAAKEDKPNRFREYATLFFYPLAHIWLNGIDVGTFDDLFKNHFLTTLRIIYMCAHPVHDYESMTQLMEQIIYQATEQGVIQPSINT